jgi:murein DD-endopeptidase
MRIVVAALLMLPLCAFAQGRTPLVQSPSVQFAQAPAAVRIGGKTHLVYELHITNLRSVEIELTRVEVLPALGDFRDATLEALLEQPAAKPDANQRTLGAGMQAVLHLWAPVDAIPSQLSHRIEFDIIRTTGREHAVVHTTPQNVRTEAPVVLGPPLRGDRWVALYDPAAHRGHRRVLYTLDGRARIPGRFAIDWMKLGDDNEFARGDETRIANWHGYGAEVLAVADATVADARDDIEELPTIADATGPVPLENASGNYIALDLGNGRCAFYEHLRQGSVRVKAGERVKQGQVIAQLGNTGSSSSGPHLHFHVADSPSPLGAEGQPFVLGSFEMQGRFDSMDGVGSGATPSPIQQGLAPRRVNELPAANSVVKF